MSSTLSLPILLLIGSLLWIEVPFVRQEEQGCGAASIAMVMQYWNMNGHTVEAVGMDVSRIMQRLYSKDDEGIRANDVARYFQQHGFKTFVFSGSIDDIKHHVQRGRPLIAALEARGRAGKLHYLVVAGIDSEEQVILVNDPAERKLLKMTIANFESRWRPTENWTLLALPKQ